MFKKAGWVSLHEVSQSTHALEAAMHERPMQSDFTDQTLLWNARAMFHHAVDSAHADKLWAFLERVPTAAVLCGTGDVVDASSDLFDCDDSFSWNGTYVHLTVGTVGSASKASSAVPPDARMVSEAELDALHARKMEQIFGPFLHCPILIGDQEFAEFCDKEWRVGRRKNPVVHSDDFISQIVEAKRQDPMRSREWIRRHVCPELKMDAFRVIFREAGKIEPLLRKPGKPSR